MDLGIDSLMAVEITLAIEECIGIRLHPTLLLELRTLVELVDYLGTLAKQELQP